MLRLPFEWRMVTGDAWMWKTDRTLENPPLNEEDWSSRLLKRNTLGCEFNLDIEVTNQRLMTKFKNYMYMFHSRQKIRSNELCI